MRYKRQQKMLCSFKYNSLSSISCKITTSQRKEKTTSKLYCTNYTNFPSLWSSFLYAKNYKIEQEVFFFSFFFPEENNKGEQNHLQTTSSL